MKRKLFKISLKSDKLKRSEIRYIYVLAPNKNEAENQYFDYWSDYMYEEYGNIEYYVVAKLIKINSKKLKKLNTIYPENGVTNLDESLKDILKQLNTK